MTLDARKAVSRHHIHLWDDSPTRAPSEIFTPEYVNHQESDVQGAGARNLGQFEALVSVYHAAFSNSKVTVTMQIAEGDKVVTKWEITATNSGDYMDLAKATHEPMTWSGVLIDRYEGDKIAESWVDWDEYRFFKGLGLL